MNNKYKFTHEQIEKVKEPKGKTKLLTYDTIFKAVFERESDILIKMMKDIFEIDETKDTFTFSGFESNSGKKSGKTYRGDLTIRLSDKSYIIIEMNYRKDKSAIDRNMVHLVRVHSGLLKKGTKDSELKKYRIRGLNLNNFYNDSGEAIENFALCNLKTNKVVSMVYSFCNISLVKCRELVYDINVNNLPNAVRWGAILLEEDIDKISQILGDDILTMEEKERLFKTIEDVNNDDTIIEEWILEENARLKYEGQMSYAREEGIDEGIKKGIEQGIEQGEENSKIEVIKNMLSKGYDYYTILDITGKTIEEIKEIENSIK